MLTAYVNLRYLPPPPPHAPPPFHTLPSDGHHATVNLTVYMYCMHAWNLQVEQRSEWPERLVMWWLLSVSFLSLQIYLSKTITVSSPLFPFLCQQFPRISSPSLFSSSCFIFLLYYFSVLYLLNLHSIIPTSHFIHLPAPPPFPSPSFFSARFIHTPPPTPVSTSSSLFHSPSSSRFIQPPSPVSFTFLLLFLPSHSPSSSSSFPLIHLPPPPPVTFLLLLPFHSPSSSFSHFIHLPLHPPPI